MRTVDSQVTQVRDAFGDMRQGWFTQAWNGDLNDEMLLRYSRPRFHGDSVPSTVGISLAPRHLLHAVPVKNSRFSYGNWTMLPTVENDHLGLNTARKTG